ncbi:MAG TPA: efflux RND transporter periplasmic adaptor subunit [Myxococcota bacterium]|nr:efflux RND transporter periplasmic adaptor subunit [Myxococcota bacterium]
MDAEDRGIDPHGSQSKSPAAPDKVRTSRPRLAWLVSILASILLIVTLAGIKAAQVMAAIAYGKSFPEPAEAVIEGVSEVRAIAPTVTAIGTLQAKNVVELRIERSGVVRAVRFASGDEVQAGAVLLELDVAEERADLEAARIDARRTEREARRRATLETEGVGTEARLEEAEAEAAEARARVAALEAAIRRKTVRAPFAGRVGITDLKPGEYVSERDLVTRVVGFDDEVWVDFALPQAAALDFDEASPVEVAIGDETIQARVVAREPAIDPGSRSLSFRAVMPRSGRDLPAGSLVTVTVPIGEAREQVVIPRTALMRSPYGDTVYVLEEKDGETRARSVLVDSGAVVGADAIVIRSGLEPGLRLAADGVFKLRDGALVAPGKRDSNGATEASESGVGESS